MCMCVLMSYLCSTDVSVSLFIFEQETAYEMRISDWSADVCSSGLEERLILIEDTPEIRLAHDNAVGLIAARSALGEAAVTANDLVSASLRMRPDRIDRKSTRLNSSH